MHLKCNSTCDECSRRSRSVFKPDCRNQPLGLSGRSLSDEITDSCATSRKARMRSPNFGVRMNHHMVHENCCWILSKGSPRSPTEAMV